MLQKATLKPDRFNIDDKIMRLTKPSIWTASTRSSVVKTAAIFHQRYRQSNPRGKMKATLFARGCEMRIGSQMRLLAQLIVRRCVLSTFTTTRTYICTGSCRVLCSPVAGCDVPPLPGVSHVDIRLWVPNPHGLVKKLVVRYVRCTTCVRTERRPADNRVWAFADVVDQPCGAAQQSYILYCVHT